MALHINNPRIEQQIRDLAQQRRQTITDVIGTAIRHLQSETGSPSPKPTVEEILQLIHSFPSSPINYELSEDGILGYGPNGYCE